MPSLRSVAAAAFVSCAMLPLAAQQLAPSPIQPVGDRIAVARSAGLRHEGGPDACMGGGADYRVRCTTGGLRFEPALGRDVATTQHLALRPTAVRRGQLDVVTLPSRARPETNERLVVYRHSATVSERHEVRPEGVELSWRFEQPLAGSGDLVVRYALDTSLPAPRADGDGLAFAMAGGGGVRIGGVTGIDARGAKVAGQLHWTPGSLELSLPASFVATARFPLVLDPIVGTIVTVNSTIHADTEPDAAYEATSDSYLVVWLRTFSATDADIRGQRVGSNGQLLGSTIYFSCQGVAHRPRVATAPALARFVIAWTEQRANGSAVVMAQAVAAPSGALTAALLVAAGSIGTVRNADVGCLHGTMPDYFGIFVAHSYEDANGPLVFVHRLGFKDGELHLAPTLWQGFIGMTEPALARAATTDESVVLVGKRSNLLGQSIVAARMPIFVWSNEVPEIVLYTTNGADSVSALDVDGRGGRWVATWRRNNVFAGTQSVMATSIEYGATPEQLVAGPVVTVAGGSSLLAASAPSVAWSPAKTWLGYRTQLNIAGGGHSLRVAGIDTETCTSCNDTFVELVGAGDHRIVVATAASGGATTQDNALAVWAEAGNIYAQRLVNHGSGGSITHLGGGCGNGGTQAFPKNPAIGTAAFRCAVTGLSSTHALLNVSPVTAPVPCGTCSWLPLAETTTTLVLGGNASVEFPIPCQPMLIGTMFETQWTISVSGEAPCSLMHGIAFSGRARLTIGQ